MRILMMVALLALTLGSSATSAAEQARSCPKLLMFDGVDIRTQTDPKFAQYWGRTVGVDGFFLNNVMAIWQTDVGTDASSPVWKQAAKFQSLYAAAGATDNFIKIAIWKPHDWRSESANASVVMNFSHATALARSAGFRGNADKSSRMDVPTFERELLDAVRASDAYVWIYGADSAWQTDGAYQKGEVDKDFLSYAAVLHRVRDACP